MKKYFILFLILLPCTIIFGQSAEEIIKKAEDAVKGEETAHGTFKMTIHTSDYARQLVMESWWQGNKNSMILTKAPKKEEGNKTSKDRKRDVAVPCKYRNHNKNPSFNDAPVMEWFKFY